jgi:hypothetical protein
MIYRGSKGESSTVCFKILDELSFYIYLFQGTHVSSGKQTLYESGMSVGFSSSLIIGCAGCWEALLSTSKHSASNSVNFALTQYRRLTKSLKLTESTACFSAARKKLFREMAARAARMRYDDPAVRCRSLAPVR